MKIQADKTRDNKSKFVTNESSRKRSSGESTFQFVDNRCEAETQKELQKMANNSFQSERATQLQAIVDNCAMNNLLSENSAQLNCKNESTIMQGKFKDLDGMQLGSASPATIGLENTYYASLWDSLNTSQVTIYVAPASGQSSYDSNTKVLYFKKNIVNDLLSSNIEPAVKVSHVATITHEMSHANDDVIKKRKLSGGDSNEHTQKVLETELRAWAREALSAYEVGEKLQAMDDEKRSLIDGWKNYDSSMLDDIKSYKDNNYIIARIWIYIRKNINPVDISEIPQWAKTNKQFIDGHASRLKGAIVEKFNNK